MSDLGGYTGEASSKLVTTRSMRLVLHCAGVSLAATSPGSGAWVGGGVGSSRGSVVGLLVRHPAGPGPPTPRLVRSLAASLPRCLGASLPRCLAHSLPRCVADSLPLCLAASLPRRLAASLPRCLAASVHRCLAASLPRCLANSLPRCVCGFRVVTLTPTPQFSTVFGGVAKLTRVCVCVCLCVSVCQCM